MSNENKADEIRIVSYNLSEYTEKIVNLTNDGYVVEGYPYKVGLCYYCTFILPEAVEEKVQKEEQEKEADKADRVVVNNALGAEEDVTTTIAEEAEQVANESAKKVMSEEEAKAFSPDWKLLDRLVEEGNKEEIEKVGKKFGIELDKRKSPKNMLKQFKEMYEV